MSILHLISTNLFLSETLTLHCNCSDVLHSFTRFECRVFLAKAFDFMDGCSGKCIIDNTHVIVASGVGPEAIITPEMEHFGRIYQTRFVPHWLNDPNRKARVERPFHYIEHNFIPGRRFRYWADLNRQAEEWCIKVANPKHKRSLGMSPDAAYIIKAKPQAITSGAASCLQKLLPGG